MKLLLYLFLFTNVPNVFGKKSFIIVLDVSQSMQSEIDVLHFNLRSIFDNRVTSQIEDYTLFLINDQHVGDPLVYENINELVSFVGRSSVTNSSSPECARNSVPGIEKALEYAKLDSYIFVFTDAPPSRGSNTDKIASLCKAKNPQVNIILSGSCGYSGRDSEEDLKKFTETANVCSGNLLRLNPTDLLKALSFIKLIISKDWNDIKHSNKAMQEQTFTIKSEAYVKDMAVCITYNGDEPFLTYDNNLPIEIIVNTTYVTVINFRTLSEREYKFRVGCRGNTGLTVYKNINLPLKIGFSQRRPQSFSETAVKPLPGHRNFISIQIAGNVIIDSLTIGDKYGNNNSLTVEFDENSRLFLASHIFKDYKPFRLTVTGHDSNSMTTIPSTTGIWQPQMMISESQKIWRKMKIDLIPPRNTTILYGSTLTLACKVTVYPRPDIMWEDKYGNVFRGEQYELYIASTYISYLTVADFIEDNYYYCKAVNGRERQKSSRIDLTVYRPKSLNIIVALKDITVRYLAEGRLQFALTAYPEVETTWYHNGSEIYSSNKNYELIENGLIIKNMTLDTVGLYSCVVTNSFASKTMRSEVTISGIDAPEIQLEEKVIVKLADSAETECRVQIGFPTPTISWTYKATGSEYYTDLPSDILATNGTIQFTNAQKSHAGTYKCQAENFVGFDSKELMLEVHYSPTVEKDEDSSTITVIEDRPVVLSCKVDAFPPATIVWMKEDTDIIQDNNISINEDNSLVFQSRDSSTGNYTCIATNEQGEDTRSVFVDVKVPPYVDIQPSNKIIRKHLGESLTLTCIIRKGNPRPTIMWIFYPYIPINNSFQTIQSETVQIERLTKDNEGHYQCIAKNNIEIDRVGRDVMII